MGISFMSLTLNTSAQNIWHSRLMFSLMITASREHTVTCLSSIVLTFLHVAYFIHRWMPRNYIFLLSITTCDVMGWMCPNKLLNIFSAFSVNVLLAWLCFPSHLIFLVRKNYIRHFSPVNSPAVGCIQWWKIDYSV